MILVRAEMRSEATDPFARDHWRPDSRLSARVPCITYLPDTQTNRSGNGAQHYEGEMVNLIIQGRDRGCFERAPQPGRPRTAAEYRGPSVAISLLRKKRSVPAL